MGRAYNVILGDNEYYEDAFADVWKQIWQGTKYGESPSDVSEMSFYRAITCFMGNNRIDLHDRRELLYYYLAKGDEFNISDGNSTLNKYRKKLPIDTSIPYILNKICVLYNQEPRRHFGKGKIDDVMNDIYQRAKVNYAMRYIQQCAEMVSVVAVTLTIRNGVYRIIYLTPDKFRIDTAKDDQYKVERFTYADWDDERSVVVYNEWTDNEYRKYWINLKYDIFNRKSFTEDTIIRLPNPYGRIPFVFVRKYPGNAFIEGGRYDLIEKQLELNKLRYMANIDATFNSMPVKLAVNLQGKAQFIAPNRVIELEGVTMGEGQLERPSLEFVAPEGQYQNLEDFRVDRLKSIYREEDIPPSIINENTADISGISRAIERISLMEKRMNDIQIFADFERELAELIRVIVNTDVFVETSRLGDLDFAIDYEEERLYIEPEVERNFDREKMKTGELHPLNYFKKWGDFDKNLTEEQLIEEINLRKELLSKIDKEASDVQVNENQEEEKAGINEEIQVDKTESEKIKEVIE